MYAMVVIGAITRLTGSGLSITEWNLVKGTFPPLTDSQWAETFGKYQSSPQFQIVNHDISLDGFKSIFWWEYIHRLLGRLIGLVFLIPFLYFLIRKQLTRAVVRRCLMIFFLGGFQGLLGWLMVKSGLVDRPSVSHFRLAAHLLTAFLTFGVIFYLLLDCFPPAEKEKRELPIWGKFKILWVVFIGLLLAQIVYGAFTAGLHAGRVFNTFPKMGEDWVPDAVFAMNSWYANLFENLAGVQFIHRCLGWVVFISGLWLSWKLFKVAETEEMKQWATSLALVLFFQFLLGVFTLLLSVPLVLGVAHQTGAFVLFAVVLGILHRINRIFL